MLLGYTKLVSRREAMNTSAGSNILPEGDVFRNLKIGLDDV